VGGRKIGLKRVKENCEQTANCKKKKQINLSVRVVHAGHWTRWTDFECQLLNAVIVPNVEPSNTTLCLQQSYAGNNAILVRKGKSNGTSLFSLQFAVHMAHCCTSLSCYNVIQFNNYILSMTLLRCERRLWYSTIGGGGVEFEGMEGGGVRQHCNVY
jgi:hypothetical protein